MGIYNKKDNLRGSVVATTSLFDYSLNLLSIKSYYFYPKLRIINHSLIYAYPILLFLANGNLNLPINKNIINISHHKYTHTKKKIQNIKRKINILIF